MRRGIDTLSCVVEHELGHESHVGDCFIFLSRDRKKLKALVWEDGGFWLKGARHPIDGTPRPGYPAAHASPSRAV